MSRVNLFRVKMGFFFPLPSVSSLEKHLNACGFCYLLLFVSIGMCEYVVGWLYAHEKH